MQGSSTVPRLSRQSCLPGSASLTPISEHLRGEDLPQAVVEHSTAAKDPWPGSVRADGSWHHLSLLWEVPRHFVLSPARR